MWLDEAQRRRWMLFTKNKRDMMILDPRSADNREQQRTYQQNQALIIAVIFIAIVVFFFLAYILLRCIRRRSKEPPAFFPEPLKKRWRAWRPGTYTSPPDNTPRLPSTRRTRRNNQTGVNRVDSVRSIMTLPEYRPVPTPGHERTIAREGERGGIDVVIEFPETIDEEEERREEHMQALYEIRMARQLERAAERESGDLAAAAAAGRPGTQSTASLIAALAAAQERERRTSQVSYASIGITRPDGSRVRPSTDSDRPLLEATAPMGTSSLSGRHGRSQSGLSYESSHETPERRRSDEIFNMGSARPSIDSRINAGGMIPVTLPAFDSVPTPDYEGVDWGAPPEYTSPVETRNTGPNQLPVLRINTATPAISRTPSPQLATAVQEQPREEVAGVPKAEQGNDQQQSKTEPGRQQER